MTEFKKAFLTGFGTAFVCLGPIFWPLYIYTFLHILLVCFGVEWFPLLGGFFAAVFGLPISIAIIVHWRTK